MSRTPVREALAVLTATGVIEQIPQVGIEIRRIGSDEASRAVQLRIGMESVVVAEVSVQERRESDELTAAMDTMVSASEAHDHAEFMLADTRLHVELARLGGFGTSLTALQGLRDRVHLFRLQQPLTEEQMQDVLEEHGALLNAIQTGDQSAAGEAIRVHLDMTRTRIEGAEAGEVESEPQLVRAR